MTEVSVSLFEGFSTKRYNGVKGWAEFSLSDFLSGLVEAGIKRSRFFADLAFFWDSAKGKPVFKAENAIKLYPYVAAKNTWDWGKLNQDYADRIKTLVEFGRKNKMAFMFCAMTQGPDYGDPFFARMGYPSADDYYDRANFDAFVKSGAFARLKQYNADLHGLLDPYGQRFKVLEVYNEKAKSKDPGMEELAAFKPKKQIFQLNMPRPIPDGVKVNILRGVGIKRFSFHGCYDPSDIKAICADAAKFGIDRNEIEISTDGATPILKNGKPIYTTESHQSHYKTRILWNKTPAMKQGTIDAHVAIRDAAIRAGIATIDFQSVLKWSEDLRWTGDAQDWVNQLGK